MAKKYKHLTDSDIAILKDYGEKDRDIEQIDDFYSHMEVTIDDKKISMKKARQLLDQRQFIAALDRAVFHTSTSVELTNVKEGNSVRFDSSKYWQKIREEADRLEPMYEKYEKDPGSCTTYELEQLVNAKWISRIDLFSNLQWEAGFGEDEETMMDQYNAGKNEIHFDTTVYGLTFCDQHRSIEWDNFIWIDGLPTTFNLKTKTFIFDTKDLTKQQHVLFNLAREDIERAQLKNLEDNMPGLFEPRKKSTNKKIGKK